MKQTIHNTKVNNRVYIFSPVGRKVQVSARRFPEPDGWLFHPERSSLWHWFFVTWRPHAGLGMLVGLRIRRDGSVLVSVENR